MEGGDRPAATDVHVLFHGSVPVLGQMSSTGGDGNSLTARAGITIVRPGLLLCEPMWCAVWCIRVLRTARLFSPMSKSAALLETTSRLGAARLITV